MRFPFVSLSLLVGACGGSSSTPPAVAPTPESRPLSFLAAERVIVTPTFGMRMPSHLERGTGVGRAIDVMRALDADIAQALEERGLRRTWILPADLVASYKRNPTYAPDPYALAEEPLRGRSLAPGTRLTEPLASQLRTMIALHENARLVLLPVELRLERVGEREPAPNQATLRLVLVDPRLSEARWVGEVKSDTASIFTSQTSAALAQRLVDLILPRS